MKFDKYFKNYNNSIYELLNNFDPSLIDQSVELIDNCKRNNGKVFIVGNGGSSSIASHVSVDFAKVANIQSETFNNANLITTFANDYGHDNWICEAIKAYLQKNDMLILISSSGTSPNMVNGARKSQSMNLHTITCSGFKNDNPLRGLGEINLWVNSTDYNVVETVHQTWLLAIVDHIAQSSNKA